MRDLPAIAPPIALEEVQLDAAIDGSTIVGYLPATDETVTIQLLGVDAPAEDECFGEQSAELLEDLASTTLYLESPHSLDESTVTPAGSAAGPDDEEFMQRYVWGEADGAKFLLNQALLQQGGAALGDLNGDARYEDWFSASEQSAIDSASGLWAECSDALPTA